MPSRVPERWRETGGVFIPMYQREAMWIYFEGADWKPNAVKIGVGGVNAVRGAAWDITLRADPLTTPSPLNSRGSTASMPASGSFGSSWRCR
jgi:hypothetical protein